PVNRRDCAVKVVDGGSEGRRAVREYGSDLPQLAEDLPELRTFVLQDLRRRADHRGEVGGGPTLQQTAERDERIVEARDTTGPIQGDDVAVLQRLRRRGLVGGRAQLDELLAEERRRADQRERVARDAR